MSLIEIDWNPNHRKLQQFALTWFCGFMLVGTITAWKMGCFAGTHSWNAPLVIWLTAALVGLMGWLFPFVVRPIYKLWMAITFPIGWILSHAVLGVIYFGLFTLVGLIFRLIGRDPLDRRGSREVESYWMKRPSGTSTKRYFQQF
ncbi:MAG: SxtJ family membrane protein [bacterium]